ncbi:hypothetical protein BBJ28_00023303 [Nothophytophthora sp. Chile5]|nr:hypothetical protein BBJ28_00023303 [Nothophytophthora sp. Chile5]
MSLLSFRPSRGPLSLFSFRSTRSPPNQRVCISAPTGVLSSYDDWDAMRLQTTDEIEARSLEHAELNASKDAVTVRSITEESAPQDADQDEEDGRNGKAGDLTDFLTPDSSDSSGSDSDKRNEMLHLDDEEPREYWGKAWSYSRSPFSPCSSISFEDSDNDEVGGVSNSESGSQSRAPESMSTSADSAEPPELPIEKTTFFHGVNLRTQPMLTKRGRKTGKIVSRVFVILDGVYA